MILVGGREFVPFKCAGQYLGGFSIRWMYSYFEALPDAPKRIYLSPCRTGFWKADLDKWLRRRARTKRGRRHAA